MKTVKGRFEKFKESGVSEFQALLDWRNTPTEGMATSPVQRVDGSSLLYIVAYVRGSSHVQLSTA